MESIILEKEYLLPGERLIIRENNKKVVKDKNSFYTDVLSEKDYSNENLEKITEKFSDIHNFQKSKKGIYIKLYTSKEIKKFDNYREDIREQRKLHISINNNEIKFYDEIFGNEIDYYLNFFSEAYKKIIQNKNQKIAVKNELVHFDCIKFDKKTTAYLFHELIGHLLEKDFYDLENNYIKNIQINFPKFLIIKHESDPYFDSLGVGQLDDLGNAFTDSVLIEDGNIKTIIDYGNYRAASIYDDPVPRMRTLSVYSTQKMQENYYDSILIIQKIWAGVVNPLTGDISVICDKALMELKGEKYYINSKIRISGKLKDLIENLVYLGSENFYKTGKCIKYGQILNVGVNGPESLFLNRNLKICRVK